MRGTRSLVVAATAGLAVAGAVVPASADTQSGRIDRGIVQQSLDRMAADGALGVQVRIGDRGHEFTARSGKAQLDRPDPVPLNGRFRAGSITKTFVSTVVLQLVGEGKIVLDVPVARYLPGLLPDGDRITVRQLLQHTSGLYNYTNALPRDPAGQLAIRYKHWEPEEVIALATAHPLDFEPGTSWNYSNTNYAVAGLVIRKVTGRTWGEEVKRRVLYPLGLTGTSVPGDQVTIPGPHAHGYVGAGDQVVDITELNASVAGAAGQLISTTADLGRFIDALVGGRLLKPAQQAELLKTTEASPEYGLGVDVFTLDCGTTVIGHNGGIAGYLTTMYTSSDRKAKLLASVNTAPRPGELDGEQDLFDEVFC
ncbi:serine hydrolase domain-containing protein [Saccharothrix violaceirubra]|uniref:D-alanyl-D-alanine carboxypeptidase n=1 Tax=Saccharothrix violaceirubra TaxID=413306 RepID=A0A7W7SYL4_9PSEU|nr:serine hydrolase domain-containing protein [Saccharothrix violaceirubra]MBB4963336.1 D-alanyl-D-alanine carboxypeptidase [Saccharothrix violaceirubra]